MTISLGVAGRDGGGIDYTSDNRIGWILATSIVPAYGAEAAPHFRDHQVTSYEFRGRCGIRR